MLNTSRHWRSKPHGGFTLVELLVVIGIIAVLISILMPALTKARISAMRTVCKSNLRQDAMAITMYANDNKGRYPSGVLYNWPFAGGNIAAPETYFGNQLSRYINRVPLTFYCPFQPFNLPADGGFFEGPPYYWAGYFYFGNYAVDILPAVTRVIDQIYYPTKLGDPRTKLMQDWTDSLFVNHEFVNSVYTDGSVETQKIAELKPRIRSVSRVPMW